MLMRKGYEHRYIDEMEKASSVAIMHAKANNEKRITANKLFNAGRARAKLESPEKIEQEAKRMVNMTKAVQGFKPTFIPKGGK